MGVERKSKGIRSRRRAKARTEQTKNPMPFDFLSEWKTQTERKRKMKTQKILRGGVRLPSNSLAADITLAAHNQITVK